METIITNENAKEILEQKLMELVEKLGNFPKEAKNIDKRAWQHLKTYIPKDNIKPKIKVGWWHPSAIEKFNKLGFQQYQILYDRDLNEIINLFFEQNLNVMISYYEDYIMVAVDTKRFQQR